MKQAFDAENYIHLFSPYYVNQRFSAEAAMRRNSIYVHLLCRKKHSKRSILYQKTAWDI